MREATGSNERGVVRAGAVAGVLAAILAVAGNALHPRDEGSTVPTGTEYLALVEQNEAWPVVHALIIVASLLFLFAQFAITRYLQSTRTATLAAVALVFAVLGGAVNMVDLLIDGAATTALADERGLDDGAVAAAAAALHAVDFALFSGIMLAFFGVPFLLYGIAVARSGVLPAWFGWLGAALAVLMCGVGLWQLVDGVSNLTYKQLFPPLAALLTLWLGALSFLVLRQLGTTAQRAGAPSHRD